jgi:hypothetical protein
MTNELVIVTNAVSHDITGLDVVNSVNGFYSGAFDKLFGMVLALIALFGVILPILIQIYQKRVMKVSESELKAEMATLLAEKKGELFNDVEEKFEAEKKSIQKQFDGLNKAIEEKFTKTEGYTAQLQANYYLRNNDFPRAALNFSHAALCYCVCDEGQNLMPIVDGLADDCLPQLSKKNLENGDLKENLDMLLEELRGKNKNGYLSTHIKALEKAMEEALKREQK